MINRATNQTREPELYKVSIQFKVESKRSPLEVVFDNVLSWRIQDDFASVRTTEGRIYAYNVDEISSFEVPFIPPPPEQEGDE